MTLRLIPVAMRSSTCNDMIATALPAASGPRQSLGAALRDCLKRPPTRASLAAPQGASQSLGSAIRN